MMLRLALAIALALTLNASHANEAQPTAADPALEARVRHLAEELRCLVCQNQTIADSNAELAVDLRNQIREKLKSGMSEAAIKQYMVDRYGDFVLYRPPVKSSTVVLWLGPFVVLIGGLLVLVLILKRRRARAAPPPLSEEEERRAVQLLGRRRDPS